MSTEWKETTAGYWKPDIDKNGKPKEASLNCLFPAGGQINPGFGVYVPEGPKDIEKEKERLDKIAELIEQMG
ncbi:MAG: hypothetical protein WCV41_00860 [Patescibacteria group bacterium]